MNFRAVQERQTVENFLLKFLFLSKLHLINLLMSWVVIQCSNQHDWYPKQSCQNVNLQQRKCDHDRKDVACQVFNWIRVPVERAFSKNFFRLSSLLIACSSLLLCDDWNWRRELVMLLVYILVNQLEMKNPVRVVEENLLKRHASKQIEHDSRESRKLAWHRKTHQIAQLINKPWRCKTDELIHNHTSDCLLMSRIDYINVTNCRNLRFTFCSFRVSLSALLSDWILYL